MREVSCRVFDLVFRALRKKGLSEESLLRGVDLPLARLHDKHERIDWADYVKIMRNAAAVWSDRELVSLGGAFLENPLVRSMGLVPRLLFSTRDFYEWATRDGSGVGDSWFSCINTRLHDLEPGKIELTMQLKDGYEHCREFFLITQGSYIAFPRLLWLPAAEVEMQVTERGAKYLVRYPSGGGKLAWARKLFDFPLAARQVANQLKQAYEELQTRYRELEAAQRVLDHQAKQLEAANRINELIRVELDLDRTLQAASRALVGVGTFTAVSLRVSTEVEGRTVTREVAAGEVGPPERAIRSELEARGRILGELWGWSADAGAEARASELLKLVVPAISIAISDALAYAAVVDYRENLERKVMQRTTELVSARDELARTVGELERAQAARDRIFANINHEIRTPLTNVTLAVADLESRQAERLDQDARRALAGIQFNVQRMLRLIDGLLLLAAQHEGKLEVKRSAFDLAAALREIVLGWSPTAELSGVELAYEGPDSLVALVDAGAMEQVVTNLVSNAIKFTPSGGRVVVASSVADGDVSFEVRDTGVGISPEFRGRIFGRFEQDGAPVQPGRRGSGIGLAIARELVEAHGGKITVESAQPRGTIFRVVLPGAHAAELTVPAGGAVHVRPEARPFTPHAPLSPLQTSRTTVLVAEDDPELLHALGRLFSREHRVLLAPDGERALELAAEHAPDVLVTDLEMPGMSGLELTEKFRALPGNRLAPALLLTAHGDLARRLDAFQAGAIDYVTKPFAPTELAARVQAHLALRDLALQLHNSEKLASLGLMLAGMAHELRNPANGLINALQPLRRLLPPGTLAEGTPAANLFEVLETCAEQVGTLARNLLNIDGGAEFSVEEIEAPVLVERARRLVESAFDGVELRTSRAYQGPVSCAAVLMIQVLANLLENAAHAAGPGGWVSLQTWVEDERWMIEVSDSGPGVPGKDRERIFEPFFTTKPPGQGTGLGLTNVRRIVQRHGGTVEVRDATHGSVFHVEIPLGVQRAVERRPEPAARSEKR